VPLFSVVRRRWPPICRVRQRQRSSALLPLHIFSSGNSIGDPPESADSSDFLLLTLLSTTRDLGTYERLGQFSRIPISLTVNLCDKVLMHSYSHFQNDRPALRRLMKKSTLLITIGTVVITAVVTVMLFILLKFLVGPDGKFRCRISKSDADVLCVDGARQ
jgi:hypothetical protein